VYYNDPSVDIIRFAQFCTTNDQQIRASYDKAKEYKKTMAGTTKPSSPYTPQQVVKEESTSTAMVKYDTAIDTRSAKIAERYSVIVLYKKIMATHVAVNNALRMYICNRFRYL